MAKTRNPAISILLAIVTLGIYGIVVSYLLARDADEATGGRARLPMAGAVALHVTAIVALVALRVLEGHFGSTVDAFAEGGFTGAGFVIVLFLTYQMLLLGMGALYTTGHARVQASAGTAGAAWAMGLVATVLLVVPNLWVFAFMPAWIVFIGLVPVVLVLVVFTMSVSAVNRLAGPATDAADW